MSRNVGYTEIFSLFHCKKEPNKSNENKKKVNFEVFLMIGRHLVTQWSFEPTCHFEGAVSIHKGVLCCIEVFNSDVYDY